MVEKEQLLATEEEEVEEELEPLEEEPEEEETEPEPSEEKEPPPKSDKIPISKYMAEKRRRQELEELLKQKENGQQFESERTSYAAQLIQAGYPEAEAHRQASERVRQLQFEAKVTRRLMESDLRDLTKEAFFADAITYTDDLLGLMRKYDIDARKAYLMLRGDLRTKEMQLDQEQMALAKRRSIEGKKEVNSSAAAVKGVELSPRDRQALAKLQRLDPAYGWTKEKFLKYTKKE